MCSPKYIMQLVLFTCADDWKIGLLLQIHVQRKERQYLELMTSLGETIFISTVDLYLAKF